ncbi:hypothetical protein LguiB_004428 [Lonicera macranthoides]
MENDERICDGCVLPISSFPLYGCEECNLFLHTSCIDFFSRLQLLSHLKHELYLTSPPITYYAFDCTGCKKSGSGFFFDLDNINLCLRCASVPTTIKHEAHYYRRLIQQEISGIWCTTCNNRFFGPSYEC